MLDRFRDFWERLGPRERRLGGLFAVVLVVCGLGYAAFTINDGLNDLERRNDDARALLLSLEAHRDEVAVEKSKQGDAAAMIGEEAQPLSTYLEKVGSEAGVQIKNQTDRPMQVKGKFQELATQIILFDLNVDQLAKFLRGIETTSPIVVTRHLVVKRSSLNKEKLDRVEVTVATYQRTKAAAAKPEETKP
jgi:Tfp pilus assembly protein PilO